MRNRRMATIIGLAAAGTLAATGIAMAATGAAGGPSEVLDGLVQEGTITQEQADAVTGAMESWHEDKREQHEQRRAETEQIVTDVTGLSADEVRERRQAGETLGEIAGDQRDALVDALIEQRTQHIDEAVAEGRITAEQAEEKKAGLAEHVEAMLDGEGPVGGKRGPHGGGPGGPGGHWGGGSDDSGDSAEGAGFDDPASIQVA